MIISIKKTHCFIKSENTEKEDSGEYIIHIHVMQRLPLSLKSDANPNQSLDNLMFKQSHSIFGQRKREEEERGKRSRLVYSSQAKRLHHITYKRTESGRQY